MIIFLTYKCFLPLKVNEEANLDKKLKNLSVSPLVVPVYLAISVCLRVIIEGHKQREVTAFFL